MKKVLYIAHLQSHIRQFHLRYLKHLKDKGYYVAVATKVDDIKELSFLDKVYDIPFARSPFNIATIKNYYLLKNIFSKDYYDIIHCHTPVAAILTRLAAHNSKCGSKVYYTAHGFHFYDGAPLINWLIYYPAELLCSKYTDVLFTMNKQDYDRASKKFKHPNVQYIHGVGIDCASYNMVVKEHDNNIINLLAIGEITKRKNHQVILKALTKLNNKNIHLYIAGSGPLKEKLQAYAIENNIDKQVHFLGFVKPINIALQDKDIFIFPSIHEGLSVALMESMASGLPIIASNIRGNIDLIDENGGILTDNSVDGYVKAINYMLNNKDKWHSMGQYNREVVKQYDYKVVQKELDRFYE